MQKFSELYRYYRLKGILRKTLLKFLFFFRIRLRITYYYVKKLDGDSLHNISVRYRDLSFDDFVRQQDVNPEWFNPEKLQRVNQGLSVEGNYAYGIYDNEVLIAYGCIASLWMVRKYKPLKSNIGYLWDDYTHPAYRGRGLHGELIRLREDKLLRLGKDTVFATVDFCNRASQVGFVRAGYKRRIAVCSCSINNGPAKTFVRKYNKSQS